MWPDERHIFLNLACSIPDPLTQSLKSLACIRPGNAGVAKFDLDSTRTHGPLGPTWRFLQGRWGRHGSQRRMVASQTHPQGQVAASHRWSDHPAEHSFIQTTQYDLRKARPCARECKCLAWDCLMKGTIACHTYKHAALLCFHSYEAG